MLRRISGAAVRGLMMAFLIATPALLLPDVAADQAQIVMLMALFAAVLTFAEYASTAPSIVEFRDARPLNRLRFAALLLTVLLLTAIAQGSTDPNGLTQGIAAIGTIAGNALNFPYSPVHLVVLMLPDAASGDVTRTLRAAAGMSYLVSLLAIVAFAAVVRFQGWPARKEAFNVWINLPLFDPTAGGDVFYRLQRDARINIGFGFMLPFVIPVVVKATSDLINPVSLENPLTLIWTITAWAFLPASMIMRGIALHRIASMIEETRRRSSQTAAADIACQPA